MFSFIIIPNYLYLLINVSLYSLIIILNSYTYRRNLFIYINELLIYLLVYYLFILKNIYFIDTICYLRRSFYCLNILIWFKLLANYLSYVSFYILTDSTPLLNDTIKESFSTILNFNLYIYSLIILLWFINLLIYI